MPLAATDLIQRRVILCLGCGGVGKTTVAAALSVAAAREGKRVLALTVDPAGRLADSLGVDRRSAERQTLSDDRCRLLDLPPGSLSVMLLDAQHTLDELVRRFAPDERKLEAITNHPLYGYLSDYLAGANEFMALERLLSVLSDGDQDLIVLDTPPTRHALDFLKAPQRFEDAMSGPVLRALIRAVEGSRRFSFDFVAKGVVAAVRSISRLTGAGTLEQVATLLSELSLVLGGFNERAARVRKALADPELAFVLVARPAGAAVRDSEYFADELQGRGTPVGLLVVNRVHRQLESQALARGVDELTRRLSDEALDAVRGAVDDELALVQLEGRHLKALMNGRHFRHRPKVLLPAVSGGIQEAAQLSQLADQLSAALRQ